MALTRTSWAAVREAVVSRLGLTRKMASCDWTPYPDVDDCSYFASSMLFGGKPGPIGWVDNWKIAKDGTYHAGSAGMQPGDVVLFDWDGNGVGNHVEFCDSVPAAGGLFYTLGANGSDTIAVKQRQRNTSWVLGYFRPSYGTISGAGSKPTPIVVVTPATYASSEESTDMSSAAYIVTKASTKATKEGVLKGHVFVIDFGAKKLRRVKTTNEVKLLKRVAPVVKTSTKGVPTRAFPPILGDTVQGLITAGYTSET